MPAKSRSVRQLVAVIEHTMVKILNIVHSADRAKMLRYFKL